MSQQSSGGKATAIILRAKALEDYYSNPNHCKHCNAILLILDHQRVPDVKKKQFCNQSCNAAYHNTIRPKRIKITKLSRTDILGSKTKEQLFKERGSYQSARSAIRKHAQITFEQSNKPKSCSKCSYTKTYQVAHIQAVSDFSGDSLISTINHIDNLIALCPNCHWEFDNIGSESR